MTQQLRRNHDVDWPSLLRWFALGALCLIWGTTWLAIKIDLQSTGPLTAVGLRFLVGGTLLLTIALCRKQLRSAKQLPWRVICVLAAFMFGISYVCTYVAETHLESGIVAVLFATLPFFGFMFGYVLLGEQSTATTWLGAAAALLGIAVVSLSGPAHGSIGFIFCALGAAASAALGNVYAKKYSHHNPMLTLPPAMLIAAAAVLVLGLSTEHTVWREVLTAPSLAALFYLAIIGSATAFLLLLWVLQRFPANVVNVSSLLYPIIAIIVGVVLGNEHFTLRDVIGTACVLSGLFFTLRLPEQCTGRS